MHLIISIKILAKIAQIIVQLLPDFGYRKIVLTWIALLLTVTNEEVILVYLYDGVFLNHKV